jgi:tripartite-type tricarboxylate transporter receptor subunit TctC
LLAPKGTPDEIINILAQAAKKALESQGNVIENRVSAMGAEILFLGPQEYSAFLKQQNEYFEKVIKELKNPSANR